MDQITRVQHLLSQRYPVFTVSAIEDVASVCGVSYSMVLTFIHLKRLQNKDITSEIIYFIQSHRPDVVLTPPAKTSEDDLYNAVDSSWMEHFLGAH